MPINSDFVLVITQDMQRGDCRQLRLSYTEFVRGSGLLNTMRKILKRFSKVRSDIAASGKRYRFADANQNNNL